MSLQTFEFGHLFKAIFRNAVMMSSRKFYCSHFHSIVSHAPETYILFCLISVLKENEDRRFGSFRNILLLASSLNYMYNQMFVPESISISRMSLFQSHFERIFDYLLQGESVWWSQDKNTVTLHDCLDNEVYSRPPPFLFSEFTGHLCWQLS